MLLIGDQLNKNYDTFIFCDITLLCSAKSHIFLNQFLQYQLKIQIKQNKKRILTYYQQILIKILFSLIQSIICTFFSLIADQVQFQIDILQQMNFINKLQSGYEQLWKLIIRPGRSVYNQEILGSSFFIIKNKKIARKDFCLTNKRGHIFACSLWLPVDLQNYACVIYLHGNSSNRLQGMEYMRKILKNNIALCTFDFSGCGNADGQYISLGYYEQQDLEIVIEHLKNYPQINRFALWGRSMGAVTALLYLKKHNNISAAIFDSPFKSLKELVEDMGNKNSNIPNFILTGGLKIIAKTIFDKANFDIFKLDPYKTCASHIMTPGLFIVGIYDQIIPIQHTKDLFQIYGSENKLIKMVKGKHNDNRPPSCIKQAIKFLIKNLNQNQLKEYQSIQSQKSQQNSKISHKDQNASTYKKQSSWLKSIFNIKSDEKDKKTLRDDDGLIQKQMIGDDVAVNRKKTLGEQMNNELKDFQYELKETKDLQQKLKEYSFCYL